MMLYAESSAVLAWLLGESISGRVRPLLQDAEIVVASELTLIECDRVLIRAVALGEIAEAEASSRRRTLSRVATGWHLVRFGAAVVDRARRPFPGEPIRTLDAIHLAAALAGRAAVSDLAMLSLDARVRKSAAELGFDVQPALAPEEG
jgi:predicted nucleic acid-binding protein